MQIVLLVWLWLSGGVARADAMPSPGRPEWSDTPLPMPSGPGVELTIALVVVAVVAIVALVSRGRRA